MGFSGARREAGVEVFRSTHRDSSAASKTTQPSSSAFPHDFRRSAPGSPRLLPDCLEDVALLVSFCASPFRASLELTESVVLCPSMPTMKSKKTCMLARLAGEPGMTRKT